MAAGPVLVVRTSAKWQIAPARSRRLFSRSGTEVSLLARDWLGILRRGLRKPPSVVARRVISEARAELDRFVLPGRARRVTEAFLLSELSADSIDALWDYLARRPFAVHVGQISASEYELLCPGDRARISTDARDTFDRRVRLLGSDLVSLSSPIDWHTDFKTGIGWPRRYFRSIDYCNPDLPSDVKVPWELSRMQWVIPLGQAYLLEGDEDYAGAARGLLEEWFAANPVAMGVNWACTMEVALRILCWTWLFHAFKSSAAWSDKAFRLRLLQALYIHGDFTSRHLELSDVNGNHMTADAVGLVFAGLFFGKGPAAQQWLATGWNLLDHEMPRQVYPDGVDFEASTAYHRLVLELYLLAVCFRRNCGLEVGKDHAERLGSMARFIASYSQPDGEAPRWGDADDARALMFSRRSASDHRYLIGIVGTVCEDEELRALASGPLVEAVWFLGIRAAARIPAQSSTRPRSVAFRHGGVFVMANSQDHVFIDCGPVGLAGRGGHGHNDCLSFEAVLQNERLIVDSGCFLYTASYKERNLFRSTAYHNTPCIDEEEINRFVRPDYLWNFHYDAIPDVREWRSHRERDILRCAHRGYARFAAPVIPERTFVLHHDLHALAIHDRFEGEGKHRVSIPLHLAPGVKAIRSEGDSVLLQLPSGRSLILRWVGPGYELICGSGRWAPSYGVVVPVEKLEWIREGELAPLSVYVASANQSAESSAAVLTYGDTRS